MSALQFVMLNHHFIEFIYNVVMSTHYVDGFGSHVVLSFNRFVSFIYYLIWSIYHLLLLIWHIILFIFYVIWFILRSIGSKANKTLLLTLLKMLSFHIMILVGSYILLLCQLFVLMGCFAISFCSYFIMVV